GTGVTVTGAGSTGQNGAVKGFGIGVQLSGASAKAQGITAWDNGTGILNRADGGVITGSSVYGNELGISDSHGAHSQITGNWAHGNDAGIDVLADGAVVSNNRALSNHGYGISTADSKGGSGASGVQLTGNVANANGGTGIVTGPGKGGSSLSKNT